MSTYTSGEDYLDYQAQVKADTASRISYELGALGNYTNKKKNLAGFLGVLGGVGVAAPVIAQNVGTQPIPNYLPGGMTP